jgi:hypothetical protein
MKTIQPHLIGSYSYPTMEHSDADFFHEIVDHALGSYSNHHYPENDFLYPSFEDEYDSYNSDFDLDTK